MKPYVLAILIIIILVKCANAQYYLKGELKDEKGVGLQGARITLFSKGNYPFYTGRSGAFGIPSNLKIDTITFCLAGFDTLKTAVNTAEYNYFTLKSASRNSTPTLQLTSLIKNLPQQGLETITSDGETYSSTVENPFVSTKNYPETGFSIHVNKASYSNIRRFIREKEQPPADAVRIEEMLNYFNLKVKDQPAPKKTFSISTNVTSCPWSTTNKLLFINIQAKRVNLDNTPTANLIFLIDVSGSMDMPNRLPLLKSAFKLLTENLRPTDQVSIITYGDEVVELLPPTKGVDKQRIIEAIEGLRPNGATKGASAIRTAYNLVKNTFITNGNNRVILATDGDFNVGQTSEKDLQELITHETRAGIYLTCLGVGMGNYKDSKLETLSKMGQGNFAYLDNEGEAEKVLVEEFAQTMYTVASQVYLNAIFNPNIIKEYRLIGFDNQKSALNDKGTTLLGGEVGSGHTLMAVFELLPNDPLALEEAASNTLVASLQLSYKDPLNKESAHDYFEATYNYKKLKEADSSLQFAASVIMFGQLLKKSTFSNNYSWDEVYELAISSAKPGDLLQKEFIELVSKAKKIYSSKRKK